MKKEPFFHKMTVVIRLGILSLLVFNLFGGVDSYFSADALATGSISGNVQNVNNTSITGVEIGVSALDGNGISLAHTCTDSATGNYTLIGIPIGTAVKVLADGSGCGQTGYAFEYWQHAVNWNQSTAITLTVGTPNRTGINFTLAPVLPSVEYFVFNLSHPIINELAVRQAIAYGTNRASILQTAWLPTGEYGTVQNSYLADDDWAVATISNSALPIYAYSPMQAQTILNNAGWVVGADGIRVKNNTRLSLSFKTTTHQSRQDTGIIFQQEMATIGIEVIPTFIPADTFFDSTTGTLISGDFDIAEYTDGSCINALDETCAPFPMFRTGNPSNMSGYSSPSADSEYDAFYAATTHADRLTHALNHQVIVMNDLPVLPLFTRITGSVSGVVKDLNNVPITGLSLEVTATDVAGNNSVVTTVCTDSETGSFVFYGIPSGISIAISATGDTNCDSDSRYYGWDYWQHVTNLPDATHLTLTQAKPYLGGIDLALGESVPVIEYFVFNFDNSILQDQAVRRAIAYGTDRLHILDTAWLPNDIYGTVENSYVADNFWTRASDASLMLYPYNPAQAQSILNADGWLMNNATGIREKNGQPLSLNFKTTQLLARQNTGAIFQQEMAQIGIQVNVEFIPGDTFFDPNSGTLATRNFDIAEYANSYCRNSLDETCGPFPMFRTGNSDNVPHYSNSSADFEYDAFYAAATHTGRLNHAINHQIIVMSDLPVLPLFTRLTPLTISGNTDVVGASLSFNDGTTKMVTSANDGTYSITVPYNWSGVVTPTHPCFTFSPVNFNYNHLLDSQVIPDYSPTIKLGCSDIDVKVGSIHKGRYGLQPSTSARENYININSGPTIIGAINDIPIIASQRVIFGGKSYSEMMGLPLEQLSKEYWFPYYNNVAFDSQLRVSNVGNVPTTITVYLGMQQIDSYTLAGGSATRKNYTGKNAGPLKVTSSATNILSTIRVLYAGSSYSEMMGLPKEQLSKEYLFPYYNNVAMDSQLRVSNLGGVPTTITVYLGTQPIDSYTLAAGSATRKNYTGKNAGPLKVTSSVTNILSTIRVLYAGSSYSEMMGLPVNQLAQEYWYPVYDNSALDSQLRVSNVGTGPTTITVYAGNTQIDSYSLNAGAASRKNYPQNTGPLHIFSDPEPILSTIRMLYSTPSFSSFYEMMGLPYTQLSTQYFFPWYNNVAMSSELRFAVP